MNLFLITQNENQNYDTYDAAVVAAEDATQARWTHPNGQAWDGGKGYSWASVEHVMAELVGEALPGTTAGVICASFCAG